MKASIVAIFGAIIPEPLAAPVMVIFLFPKLIWVEATLLTLSLVIIASEKFFHPLTLRLLARSGAAFRILSIGKGYPMIPVEQIKTCQGLIPNESAAHLAIDKASSSPFFPLQAFAFPLLTITALISERRRCFFDNFTGAALTWFVVNAAVETVVLSEKIKPRSSLLFPLMPE